MRIPHPKGMRDFLFYTRLWCLTASTLASNPNGVGSNPARRAEKGHNKLSPLGSNAGMTTGSNPVCSTINRRKPSRKRVV